MPTCGSQVVLCDLPVRFDTYKGCSHACRYCFVQRKVNIANIEKGETVKSLIGFIEGKRDQTTNWCDWDIPLHWGGVSDPFQPAEKEIKNSLECLKVFAKTGYPFIVSTKGRLVADDEYLGLLSKCNAVVQISMVCDKYDKLEQGAPTYEERLKILEKVSPVVRRTIVRIQPYMTEVLGDVLSNMKFIKAAGAYGVTIEGMKFIKAKPGLVKTGADFVFPVETLRRHYMMIRDAAHNAGLKFYCAENRLRSLGDNMTCCGTDGLDGFKVNEFNLCNMIHGKDVKPTQRMCEAGTAYCFKALHQETSFSNMLKTNSMRDVMLREYNEKRAQYHKMFNK